MRRELAKPTDDLGHVPAHLSEGAGCSDSLWCLAEAYCQGKLAIHLHAYGRVGECSEPKQGCVVLQDMPWADEPLSFDAVDDLRGIDGGNVDSAESVETRKGCRNDAVFVRVAQVVQDGQWIALRTTRPLVGLI